MVISGAFSFTPVFHKHICKNCSQLVNFQHQKEQQLLSACSCDEEFTIRENQTVHMFIHRIYADTIYYLDKTLLQR